MKQIEAGNCEALFVLGRRPIGTRQSRRGRCKKLVQQTEGVLTDVQHQGNAQVQDARAAPRPRAAAAVSDTAIRRTIRRRFFIRIRSASSV